MFDFHSVLLSGGKWPPIYIDDIIEPRSRDAVIILHDSYVKYNISGGACQGRRRTYGENEQNTGIIAGMKCIAMPNSKKIEKSVDKRDSAWYNNEAVQKRAVVPRKVNEKKAKNFQKTS